MSDETRGSARRQRQATRLEQIRERIRERAHDQVLRRPARAAAIVGTMVERLEGLDPAGGAKDAAAANFDT